MSNDTAPGPIGVTPGSAPLQGDTLQLQPAPPPGPLGTTPVGVADTGTNAAASPPGQADEPPKPEPEASHPDIDALDLAETARKAAYALRKAHPQVTFTSGRRTKQDQARAMSGNVVANRKWIEQTYAKSGVRDACQKWVDDNADKKTAGEIETGLASVLDQYTDSQLSVFSKHLSGMAFDVQPVTEKASEIIATVRGLEGLDKFLEQEGGLVRWHAQFK